MDPEVAELTEEGVLFRLDHDGTLKTMHEKITIPNGITWNAKNDTVRTYYHSENEFYLPSSRCS